MEKSKPVDPNHLLSFRMELRNKNVAYLILFSLKASPISI